MLADQADGLSAAVDAALPSGGKEAVKAAVAPDPAHRFNIFSLISLFVALVAVAAYVNARFVKLPSAVGTMLAGIVFALVLTGLGSAGIVSGTKDLASLLDQWTTDFVLSMLLGLLLFAGALQLDTKIFMKYRWSVTYAATLGTLLTILMTGALFWAVMHLLNPFVDWDWKIPIIGAFLFATIIAPTDSVVVVSILRRIKVAPPIRAYVAGEALFNDATAIVLFLLISPLTSVDQIDGVSLGLGFLRMAGGALILGLVMGMIGAYFIDTIEQTNVRVLITIGIALGTGGLADAIGVSNAVAVAIAGITFVQRRSSTSAGKDSEIHGFWSTIDGVLNPLFFGLIGLELLTVEQWTNTGYIVVAAIICVPTIIVARYLSLLLPWLAMRRKRQMSHAAVVLMTWIGVRGGVSFALALSLPPDSEFRKPVVISAFVVVVISLLVQGLTIGPVAKRLEPALSK